MTSARRVRVLQVVTHLDLGGAEEIAVSLAERLHTLVDGQVFAVNGVAASEVGRTLAARLARVGVPIVSGSLLPLKRGGFLQAAARLAGVVRRTRPDVVHLHTEIPELTWTLARALLGPVAGGPRVTRTLHNTVFWGPWGRIGRLVERQLRDVPVAACSQAALQAMQSLRTANGLRPLDGAHSRVIYNGVAPARWTRRARTAGDGPLRVLFAGRLEAQKGADLLPELLARAHAAGHPAAELHVFGTGSLHGSLSAWAAGTVPGWTVRLHPPTPHLREEMSRHDLLLMPSRFEGLGLVAAEALMAELPVVGTDAPGLREVFPDGYPLLTAGGDTAGMGGMLARTLRAPERAWADAPAWAAVTTARFGLDRMAAEYRTLYQDLTGAATRTNRSGARPSRPTLASQESVSQEPV